MILNSNNQILIDDELNLNEDLILTQEDIKKVLQKCVDIDSKEGFLFFLKNFIKTTHPSKGVSEFKNSLYKWQKEAAKEFLMHKFIIYSKRRQVGASTLSGAYALYRALFFPNQNIIIISLGQRESSEFLEKIKFMYEQLPMWLKIPALEFAKTFLTLKNGSKIKSLPLGANVTRSASASLLIFDEFAFYRQNIAEKLISAAIPALSAGLNEEFTNKTLPSQLFIISTFPQFVEGNEYMRLYNLAIENPQESKFHLINVEVDDIPYYKDKNWHALQLEALGRIRYEIEILGKPPIMSEDSFLPKFILENLTPLKPLRIDFLYPDSVDEKGFFKDFAKFYELKENFDEEFGYCKGLWIFHNPLPGKEYGIAADVATGRGNDFSAFHVFDLETNEQVASYKNKINIEDYKKIILKTALYYNNAKVSIESNLLGENICQWFAYTIQYEKFYFTKISNKKIVPGFYLGSNRGNILAAFETYFVNLARENKIKINDIRTINELKAFGWKNGRAQALSGNDDLVMALAQYFYLKEEFFSTSKKTNENLIFGELLEEEKIRNKHFLNDLMWYYNIDNETREIYQLFSSEDFNKLALVISDENKF